MVVINIQLQTNGKVKDNKINTHVEINLLKREDATEAEWTIAKAIEAILEVIAMNAASEIKSFTRIKENG